LLPLLLEHFGIPHDDKNCWLRLSLALAYSHVPAFQLAGKVGGPRKWDEKRDAIAKIAVDRFIEEHPRSTKSSAAALLAKQGSRNWKGEVVDLADRVDRFVKKHGRHTIGSAAAQIAKLDPWRQFLGDDKDPGEKVRQAYYRASEKKVNEVLALEKKMNKLPLWRDEVERPALYRLVQW